MTPTPSPTPDNSQRNQPNAAPNQSPASTLWAPWRLPYLESIDDEPKPAAEDPSFLANYWRTPERDHHNHVIHRDDAGMILLNGYPYANGHLLVALGEPRPRLLDYDPHHRAHLFSLVTLACDILETGLEPQGVNIGINQGRAAGAGVPQHLHAHLVPRWSGDVNFMTTVAAVRVIPAALQAMAERLRKAADIVKSQKEHQRQ